MNHIPIRRVFASCSLCRLIKFELGWLAELLAWIQDSLSVVIQQDDIASRLIVLIGHKALIFCWSALFQFLGLVEWAYLTALMMTVYMILEPSHHCQARAIADHLPLRLLTLRLLVLIVENVLLAHVLASKRSQHEVMRDI